MKTEKIGIVGSGLIGRAWSMLFASVGYQVMLYDVLPEQMHNALIEIERELHQLESERKLRGSLSASEQFACISIANEIEQLTHNAIFIQECIPERLELKQSFYKQLDAVLASHTILSSSTSTFMPSLLSDGLHHKHNILISHPLNPPYFIPLVEIVPAPWTSATAIERTRTLMLEIGQRPVVLQREVQGFATNRIQYAILAEVWHLVADGILSAADVDAVMTYGLGLRYAHAGPLETAHLNADGIADYFQRYGKEINTVCSTFAPAPNMSADADNPTALTEIARQCEALLPREQLAGRRAERSRFLTALAQLKRQF